MDVLQKARRAVFKRFALARVNGNYINMPPSKIALRPMSSGFLLITPAFNDFELVKLQHSSLKKLEDVYDHIIADSSSDADQAKAIESFCAENGIGYVHLPQPNPGLDRSLSHGFALNWIFYNVVKKIKPERFGFLESDLLVASPGSFLTPWRHKDFWGVKAPSQSPGLSDGAGKKFWRLWPGFCFFSRDFCQDKDLNFLPARHIDTGGMNFGFFKDLDTSHLIPWEAVVVREVSEDGAQKVQAFANVIHLVGMSMKSDNRDGVNQKREFAYNVVFDRRRPS